MCQMKSERRQYHEIANAPTVPFFDAKWMRDLQQRVFAEAQPDAQKVITPDTKYCFFVNRKLQEALNGEEGVQAKYIIHEDQYSHRGVIDHAFVKATYDRTDYVLDMQYKQFVPDEKRDPLPDQLVIPYRTKQDLVSGLTAHEIPPEVHEYWTEELFPQPVSLVNLQTKPTWANNYGLGYKDH